jgi:hypothetical protein
MILVFAFAGAAIATSASRAFDRGLLIRRVYLAQVLGALANDVYGPAAHHPLHCLPHWLIVVSI